MGHLIERNDAVGVRGGVQRMWWTTRELSSQTIIKLCNKLVSHRHRWKQCNLPPKLPSVLRQHMTIPAAQHIVYYFSAA